MELLNQRMTRREYSSALVCAAAVLGVTATGWKTAATYPPIISRIVKLARFMVIQKALEMCGPDDEDESPYDFHEYESDGTGPPDGGGPGCLSLVSEMMDRFMVRGSQSPM